VLPISWKLNVTDTPLLNVESPGYVWICEKQFLETEIIVHQALENWTCWNCGGWYYLAYYKQRPDYEHAPINAQILSAQMGMTHHTKKLSTSSIPCTYRDGPYKLDKIQIMWNRENMWRVYQGSMIATCKSMDAFAHKIPPPREQRSLSVATCPSIPLVVGGDSLSNTLTSSMPSLTIAAQPSSGNPFTAWLNPLQQTHHPWQQWATANSIHLPICWGECWR